MISIPDMSRTAREVTAPPRVLFLVRSFGYGGAERQLVTLMLGLKQLGWPVSVACFYGGGPLETHLHAADVTLHVLMKRGRWDVVGFLFRLWRLLNAERPTILHGYLPIANLLAALMRAFFPRMRIVWGVRCSNVDLSQYDWLMRLSFWLESCCARLPHLVIANSQSGARLRIAHGFPQARLRVISNGIDIKRFQFDPEGRERLRRHWDVPDSAILVGLVGRLHPMKDHGTFLQAASVLAAHDERWRFVCIGGGSDDYKATLIRQANALGLEKRLVWAGAHDDMAAAYSTLDIASSASSSGEGFSNVVAEAMACGRPCVVTDVGDSREIVGETGIVVPPHDARALAAGIEQLQMRLDEEGEDLSEMARARIANQFGVQVLVARTAALLNTVLTPRILLTGNR
jgi:glycosyltransferase involved in cell wall biosynthesis